MSSDTTFRKSDNTVSIKKIKCGKASGIDHLLKNYFF